MLPPRLRHLRPAPSPADERLERDSTLHLQELYTVAVGLALSIGVERLLPTSSQGWPPLPLSLLFVGLVATLIPFYQGAQRHLDVNYIHSPGLLDPARDGRKKSLLLLGDFVVLFVEAVLLIAMAASVGAATHFALAWLLLLVLDVVWLTVFVIFSPREAGRVTPTRTIHRFSWAVVNVPFIVIGSLGLVLVLNGGPGIDAWWLCVLTVSRTILDYSWSWTFYFGDRRLSVEHDEALNG